jgi:hypothetical protein
MLATDSDQSAAANVISLADYRRRWGSSWHDDPPDPQPVAARKAREDALLAEVVVADAAGFSRVGWRQCA